MKYILRLLLIVVTCNYFQANAQKKGLEFIDREILYSQPFYTDVSLSPDGNWISFIKTIQGVGNLYVKAINAGSKEEKPVTNYSSNTSINYRWSRDGKYIVYITEGSGSSNLFSVPMSDGAAHQFTSNPLGSYTNDNLCFYWLSEINPETIFIGIGNSSKYGLNLVKVNIIDGRSEILHENHQNIIDYYIDNKDSLRFVMTGNTDRSRNIHTLYPESSKDTILKILPEEIFSFQFWNADNSKFYYISNHKDDLAGLYEYDVLKSRSSLTDKDPQGKSDLYEVYFDEDKKELSGSVFFSGKPVSYWKSEKFKIINDSIQSWFPGKFIQFQNINSSQSKLLFKVSSDTTATEYYYFDTTSKTTHFLLNENPAIQKIAPSLSPMQEISYKSKDGIEIQAYVTLPNQKKQKKLPLIVLIHDQPFESRIFKEYQAEVQYWANRGFAVFQPNYRGSTGFGKKFTESGYQQLGDLMQDDITYGVKKLILDGIAHPKEIIIMGTGFGGYSALMGLALHPDLYAAGIDINGYNQLESLVKSVPDYWKNPQSDFYKKIGNPDNEDDLKKLRQQSPLNRLSAIKKPLLIVQNDINPFVRTTETYQLVSALKDKIKVQYLLIKDGRSIAPEGQYGQAVNLSVLKFISEILEKEFPLNISPETDAKIQEITIDVKHLQIPDLSKFKAEKLPQVKTPFSPSEYSYKVTYQYNGLDFTQMKYKKTRKEGTRWKVEETYSNEETDRFYYDLQFSPMFREGNFSGKKNETTFANQQIFFNNSNGQYKKEAPVSFLVNGPGLDYILGNFPLHPDYQLQTYVLDITSDVLKPSVIKVTGEEDLNNSSHFIVEITNFTDPEDKITFWIDKRTKLMTKSVQKIPELGNTIITVVRHD